jgi:hypothetical protein
MIPGSNTAISFSVSILLHVIIFIIAAFVFKITTEKSVAGGYVQIKTRELINNLKDNAAEKEKVITKNYNSNNKINKSVSKTETEENLITSSDTSGLYQVYKESTLDVSMRYPVGWTYIDQDVKNKLDGVTFWAVNGIYSPPPYVHLEVKEKYLFNPSRYKYSIKTDDYIAYYNDPEELSGQVSQEVYIRTGIDEDFTIKLIMEGRKSFNAFQPVFFGMIKTFKFDNSIF